jgi:hypothetical protein
MPLCFEVTINDELPIVAGFPDLKVLTAILTFVPAREELGLQVGGMLDRSDHVTWLEREITRGDVVTVRIIDSDQTTEPATRKRTDPSIDAAQERAYYEHCGGSMSPRNPELHGVRRPVAAQYQRVAGCSRQVARTMRPVSGCRSAAARAIPEWRGVRLTRSSPKSCRGFVRRTPPVALVDPGHLSSPLETMREPCPPSPV